MADLSYIGAGELTEPVTLSQPSNTADGYGQPNDTYTDLATVFAKITFSDGRSEVDNSKGTLYQEMTAIIHYRSDITGDTRITYDGDAYDILAPVPMGRKRYLKLICERRS